MSQTVPIRLTCLDTSSLSNAPHGSLVIRVDARTTALDLQDAIVTHDNMPKSLTRTERRQAVASLLGNEVMARNPRLFPDACPSQEPFKASSKCPVFVAPLPDGTNRWAVIDGDCHSLEGIWETRNEAMSHAWEIAEKSYGLTAPNPLYAGYALSLDLPKGYDTLEFTNEDGSSFWISEREGDPYEPVVDEFPSEIEARINAWHDSFLRLAQAS